MANENTLEITTNGKYNNIDLMAMEDGDTITLTKGQFPTAKEIKTTKDFGDGPKELTSYLCSGTYKDTQVGFFLPSKLHSTEDKLVWNNEIADRFNEVGGEGDTIKITCHRKLGKATYDFKPKHSKDEQIVKTNFIFELVE